MHPLYCLLHHPIRPPYLYSSVFLCRQIVQCSYNHNVILRKSSWLSVVQNHEELSSLCVADSWVHWCKRYDCSTPILEFEHPVCLCVVVANVSCGSLVCFFRTKPLGCKLQNGITTIHLPLVYTLWMRRGTARNISPMHQVRAWECTLQTSRPRCSKVYAGSIPKDLHGHYGWNVSCDPCLLAAVKVHAASQFA